MIIYESNALLIDGKYFTYFPPPTKKVEIFFMLLNYFCPKAILYVNLYGLGSIATEKYGCWPEAILYVMIQLLTWNLLILVQDRNQIGTFIYCSPAENQTIIHKREVRNLYYTIYTMAMFGLGVYCPRLTFAFCLGVGPSYSGSKKTLRRACWNTNWNWKRTVSLNGYCSRVLFTQPVNSEFTPNNCLCSACFFLTINWQSHCVTI